MKKKFFELSLYFAVLRPYQWIKNLLVFSGLIFSTSLLKGDVIFKSLFAFGIFCVTSSGVYILNDLRDIKADKKHPVKMKRPIASGVVSKITAGIIMSVLLFTSLLLAFLLDKDFFLIVCCYVGLNVVYSFGLKNVVILDALIVATGFLLRAFAGCVVIKVEVTPWLFICTLSLALILSFGKRRNELNILKINAKEHRETLQLYNVQLLDTILTVCSALAIGTYSLYTMAAETVLRIGSQRLIITTLFVMYGVFRYLYLIYTENKGGDPTKLLLKDIPTIVNGILWILCIIYIIYGSKLFSVFPSI